MAALDLNTLLILLCVLESLITSARVGPYGLSPILSASVTENFPPKTISRDIGKKGEASLTKSSWKEQEILNSERNCTDQFGNDIAELKYIDTTYNKGQPHPLRTCHWRISRQHYELPFCRKMESEIVYFHPNFTLSADQGRRGNWRVEDGSVIWTTHIEGKNETRYRAELFWNAFGDQPRMVRVVEQFIDTMSDKCGRRFCCEPLAVSELLAVNPWPVKMGKSCACERP